jgi:NitT/TauT family transport system substrate-binding protein
MATEVRKGDLRALFTGGDAFGPYSVIFQVVTNAFLKKNPEAVKSYLADYVGGLQWFYDPANRKKAIEITADFTKSPADVLDSYFMTKGDYYRDPHGCLGAKTIQTPIDAMHSEGLIDKPVNVAEHLNMGLLPYPCSV